MVGVPLCAEKRAYVIEHYFRTQSYKEVFELYKRKFPGATVPNKSTIQRLVDNFRSRWTLEPRKRERRCTVLTPENVADISKRVRERPSTSVRKLASQMKIHPSSAYRGLKTLKLPAFRAMLAHELLPPDPLRRLKFCKWFQKFIQNSDKGISALEYVFFSDEAWFHKSGYVNAGNFRIWCSENPHVYRKSSLHSQKIGVWCALSRKRIIGPIFFTSTINAEAYHSIIRQFVSLLEEDERDCWFQQDGAAAHTSEDTLDFLAQFFDDRIISKGLWPLRSPDLNPLDFFLWGHLKNRVFRTPLGSMEDLKRRITEEINAITPAQLCDVFSNLIKRVALCKDQLGTHFQQFL
ncbi:hypothetical protein V9T40_003428 [Parthenolecanium corni]|uniref:DUF4817 domain-containing protein n=1 Tax=Parthenolecanium corni TaxID=536013 RepID=A0AAN9TQL9_9HEMI